MHRIEDYMGIFNSKQKKHHITAVQISDICQKSYPCKHSVVVLYSDGSAVPMHLDGLEVLKRFSSFFTKSQREHFEVYDFKPDKL